MSKKKVLTKLTILCWAAFIAILGCMGPVGRGLDTPAPWPEGVRVVGPGDNYTAVS